MAELHWLVRLGLKQVKQGRSRPLPWSLILGKWFSKYILALIIGGTLGFILGWLYPHLPLG